MKKFLLFFTITLVLFGIVFGMYMEYIHISAYPVFVESYEHGTVSVSSEDAVGSDNKYKVMCKKDSEITININPERTPEEYYNLKKLTVNGVDVTKQVSMLQYKTTVTQKLTIVATFEQGERPENDDTLKLEIEPPSIDRYADNSYLGSHAAYDIEDPVIFYDEESEYYYCFGSNNVVVRSTDLVNWTNRTTYFKHPENASTNTIMDFDQFDSVSEWASEHGYSSSTAYSDKYQNRAPLSPELVKVDSTYYLYFSLCKEDYANEAAIFCVKTDNLKQAIEDKKWTDSGLVISTCGNNAGTRSTVDDQGNTTSITSTEHYDEANAVHPSVIYNDKNMYMVYGGYYGNKSIGGELYLLELNPSTGLLKTSSELTNTGSTISTLHGETRFITGTLIADPGRVPAMSSKDGSLISGADIVYNKDNGYYYLFITYGLRETGSSIVVARSASISGPYVDFHGNNIAEYSEQSMYDKGYLLMGGYNFINSSSGNVSYTDVGRASIASPTVIKTSKNNWYIGAQSQIYFKSGTSITTGKSAAESGSLNLCSQPALEVRELRFSENGWPMADSQIYSGTSSKDKLSIDMLYGNWDVLVFDNAFDSDSVKAVERRESSIVSILKQAVISQNDIAGGTEISYNGSFTKNGDGYNIVIDSVTYTVYPEIAWDWELKEGSIVFTGLGDNGRTIWAKKKLSSTKGLYTDTFYYVYSKCQGEIAQTITQRIEKMSVNPSQSQIDFYTDWMLAKLTSGQ